MSWIVQNRLLVEIELTIFAGAFLLLLARVYHMDGGRLTAKSVGIVALLVTGWAAIFIGVLVVLNLKGI